MKFSERRNLALHGVLALSNHSTWKRPRTTCLVCLTGIGWTKTADKAVWRYATQAEKGVSRAKVTVTGALGRRVKFDVRAKGLRLPKLKDAVLPLEARFILDGRCGNATFAGPLPAPVCAFSQDRTELDCR